MTPEEILKLNKQFRSLYQKIENKLIELEGSLFVTESTLSPDRSTPIRKVQEVLFLCEKFNKLVQLLCNQKKE